MEEIVMRADLGNGISVSAEWDIESDGRRAERKVLKVDVQFQGVHEGSAVLNESLDWPEDGVEWDICPSEWESIESDIQDWVEREIA